MPNINGWKPSRPDSRDLTIGSPQVAEIFRALGVADRIALPSSADLRSYCSPVEDQGNLGSCTAQALAGVVEYLERKAFGAFRDSSRLFTYKITRNMLGLKGDMGADLRTTAASSVLFGVLPEKYWPYQVSKFDQEPTALMYSMARNYMATSYVRLDPQGTTTTSFLSALKASLAAGWPAMFGFDCFASIQSSQVSADGKIPYPSGNDPIIGGHAVTAVGYDDSVKCPGASAGSVLIRNSWGPKWGLAGYGWLPYQYFLSGHALDCWTLTKMSWVDSGQFGL